MLWPGAYNSGMVPHVSLSALFRSVLRILGGVVLVLAVLGGMGAAVLAQAGREEATRADAALLLVDGSTDAQAARLDRAARLYLGGQVSRVILAGRDPTLARDTLIARGVLQDKIAEARDATQIGQIEAAKELLKESRVTDVMLIGEPVEALRLLKIARDRGLALQSAPASAGSAISLREVVEEVGRYLVYCFVGR